MSTKIITSNCVNHNIFQYLPANLDEQFQIGLKIILCSYENKENAHKKEICDLKEKVLLICK